MIKMVYTEHPTHAMNVQWSTMIPWSTMITSLQWHTMITMEYNPPPPAQWMCNWVQWLSTIVAMDYNNYNTCVQQIYNSRTTKKHINTMDNNELQCRATNINNEYTLNMA